MASGRQENLKAQWWCAVSFSSLIPSSAGAFALELQTNNQGLGLGGARLQSKIGHSMLMDVQ
jgi:hypothetical protein